MVQFASAPVDAGALDAADAVEHRRREILAAASAVFRRRGFAATGMREIAAELGMTAGNLYYYFRGKDDLLAYCQETTLDALLAGAEAVVGESHIPDIQKLRRVVVAHVVCLNETFPGSLAHFELEPLPADRRAPLARKRKRYERLLTRLIESGQAAGALRPGDVRLALFALLGAMNWTVKWFSAHGDKSALEVGERFAEIFLEGLAERRP
jgi:AcrR family transcriptional regulator